VKKAERQSQILKSAAQLFSERRFDEVLMDDIAHEAGVAKGTLYSYFQDKEELYFAVVFDGIHQLNERLQREAGEVSNPEAQLREMIHSIVSFFRQNRFFFKLMSIEDAKAEAGRGTNRQRWRQERRQQIDAIEAVLSRGVDQGVFDVSHPRIQAHILRDMVRSAMMAGGDLSVDEMVSVIAGTFLHGVRRPY
jgi:AcrR family transcriptional regulator